MNKTAKVAAKRPVAVNGAYNKLENWLLKNNKKVFYSILIFAAFLALISFNARVSEGNDDSNYIEAGYKYVNEFPNYYYTFNAPLYPMFLGLLTLIFGTNLVLFKVFSVIFFILGAIIFYKALDKKISEILKFAAFIFVCTNHLIIYYSSQTYSESFYLVIQAAFFYYFLKYNFGPTPLTSDLRAEWKKWLVIGFFMLLLSLAKNIMILGIVAIALFYLFQKEYKKMFFSLASFALFKVIFDLIKRAIWGNSALQYKSQGSILLNKNPYDASEGQEDIWGFFGRFIDNIGLYLGKRFYQIMGFTKMESEKSSYFLAIIILALTLYGLFLAIKNKNKIISFLILFSGTAAFGTFFVLQTRWDQPRLVMVHMPVVLLGIFYGLYQLFKKDDFMQRLFISLIFIVLGSGVYSTLYRGIKNIPIVSKNLKGDIYYGYTPDWKNYLQLSAYCNDSLPKNSFVACRKAPMSFVYAKGKHFYPVYSVIAKDTVTQQSNPDSALAIFKKNKVTHLLIASLRLNPLQQTENIINTMHNIAGPIMQKYPEKLKPVKQIGDNEEAVLYEIKY
jgi:hypothetical protein